MNNASVVSIERRGTPGFDCLVEDLVAHRGKRTNGVGCQWGGEDGIIPRDRLIYVGKRGTHAGARHDFRDRQVKTNI